MEEWIKVTDQKPQMHQKQAILQSDWMLVCTNQGSMLVARLQRYGTRGELEGWKDRRYELLPDVVYWRPLPEKPEELKNESE